MGEATRDPLPYLRLHATSGVGPTLGRRLLARFARPEAIFEASPAMLQQVEGIGPSKARSIAAGFRESEARAQAELQRASECGARVLHVGHPEFPPLLAELPDAPLCLYVRGSIGPHNSAHTVAIVGSRKCTPYGMEQAERFSSILSQAGLTIVSGGARGIDSAAHRAAVRVGAPTIAVLGCGIGRCYPPENAALFQSIVDNGGAIVSELPVDANPAPENFPARNRIISGLSLGVIVIEAPRGSGALITARHAVEEHGREVMAVPGRVDSASSEGCLELIKRAEAALVVSPSDVVECLEPQARHVHQGTHASRYAATPARAGAPAAPAAPPPGLSEGQALILEALGEPAGLDDLQVRTGLAPDVLSAEVTLLEIRGLVERSGAQLARRGGF